MRRTASVTIAGLCIAAAVACHAAPPPAPVPMPAGAPVGLNGIVQDLESYTRLQSAVVELSLLGNTNQPVAATVTDEHGNFAFAGVPAGTYVLRIGRPGYTETRMRVEVKTVADKPLDVRLRSLRTRCVPSRYHTEGCP